MPDYNLGTASGKIEINGKAAAAGFKVAQSAGDAFMYGIKKKVSDVETFGKRLVGTGAAGVAGFGLAIKAATGFEAQMSAVNAVTNTTIDNQERLRKKALQLGADTVYSATEAASAIEELAKAGIPVEDILNGAAAGAVALAAAGGVGLEEAATIASNAMNAFGISAEKIPQIADSLAGVANVSAADVGSLGASLSQAGAVANLAGLSFEDTAIALGELADAGINGSDAGTSLKTMLNNLIPSTDKQKAAFRELGILTYDLAEANETLAKVTGVDAQKSIGEVKDSLAEYVEGLGQGTIGTVKNAKAVDKLLMQYGGLNNAFFNSKGELKSLGQVQEVMQNGLRSLSEDIFDANGKMKSQAEIQKLIKTGAIDATNAQKLQNLELLFGADAMRAAAIMSKAGKEGYQEFKKEVGNTSAEEVARERLNNLSGAVEQLKGSFETAMITIGSVFIPIVQKVVNAVTWMINKFNELPKGVQTAIAIIIGLASILSVLVGAFLASITVIGTFLLQWYAFKIIRIATGYLKTFIAVQRGGLGVMAAHSAAMNVASGRFSRFILMNKLAAKASLLFGKAVLLAGRLVAFAFSPIGLIIAAVIIAFVLLYKKNEAFRNAVNRLVAVIKGGLIAAWNYLLPLLQRAGAFLVELGQKIKTYVVNAFLAALPYLIRFGKAIIELGKWIGSTLLPVLKQVASGILSKLISGFKSIAESVMTELVPAFQQFVSKFNGAGGAASSFWAKAKPVLSAIISIAQAIGSFLVPILQKMGEIFVTVILPILIKVAGFLTGVLIDAVVGLVKGIIDVVTGVIKVFTGLIDFFMGVFTGDWGRAWEGIKSIVSGIVQAIWGIIQVYLSVGILKLVGFAFRGLLALVRAGWQGILALFRGAGAGIWGAVKWIFGLVVKIIRTYIRVWVTVLRAVWRAIIAIFRGAGPRVIGIVRSLVMRVVNFYKSMGSTVLGFVRGMWNKVVSFTRSLLNRWWNTIKNVAQRVLDFFAQLPANIMARIRSLASDMLQMGKDMIMGMINGVKAMAGQLKDAAKNAVKGAIDGAKDLLHIGSPSKLFHQFGVWTIQGQINGMNKEAPRLYKAAAFTADKFVRTYKDTTDKMQSVDLRNRVQADQLRRAILAYHNGGRGVAATAQQYAQAHNPLGARPDRALTDWSASRPTPPRRKGGEKKRSRLVEGRLRVDEDSVAWIEGIAEDVYDENERFEDVRDGRGVRGPR